MANIKKADWLDKFSKFIGDDTSEEAIELIEDVSDSWDEGDGVDWKAKYDELDGDWKKRYRDRFFDGGSNPPKDEGAGGKADDVKEEIVLRTYDDFYKSIEVKD